MTIYAPAHRLIYLAPHSMHLAYLSVTRSAFESCANVRLVGVEGVRLRLNPVHAPPRRLLFTFREGRELLHLRAVGPLRLMATHARSDVWNSCVRRFVDVLVTEGALEFGTILLGHVLPVIEFDGLLRRFRFTECS